MDWWRIATLLTVPVGWLVVHLFARKAQRDHYHGEMILEAGSSVSDDLLHYIRWLLEHSKMIDQMRFLDGAPVAEDLQRLSEHAAHPFAMDWVLTSRANERILEPVFPAMRFVTIELVRLNNGIRTHIENGALGTPTGTSQISSALMAQSERADRFRELLVVSVRNGVFGRPRFRAFFARIFPRWYQRWYLRKVERPARRVAVTVLGEDVVARGESERAAIRDRQDRWKA